MHETLDSTHLREQPTAWRARLELEIARTERHSTIVSRRHEGPLVVQRPFFPEPDGTCHVLIVHPPGGLVSGDSLELSTHVQAHARALLTTPAATKFYRARTGSLLARQAVSFEVAQGAQLEWLPQETIAFAGTRGELSTCVNLAASASFLGWEIVCLGRPASDESFGYGSLVQRTAITLDGKLLWMERMALTGGSSLLYAACGLRSEPVVATFLAVGEHVDEEAASTVRSAVDTHGMRGLISVSARDRVLITRYLGPSGEEARAAFQRAWTAVRPLLLGKPAIAPRIWKT